MDGEIASEHYAGVRYRQPEIGEALRALRVRHRLGVPTQPRATTTTRATASSARASAASPAASTSPSSRSSTRSTATGSASHRATSRSTWTGNEVYDVYYANDTASRVRRRSATASRICRRPSRPSSAATARSSSAWPAATSRIARPWRPPTGRATRPCARRSWRRRSSTTDVAQLDLLRLAIFGLDVDLSAEGPRRPWPRPTRATATTLISESLQVPMEPGRARRADRRAQAHRGRVDARPLARRASTPVSGEVARRGPVRLERRPGGGRDVRSPDRRRRPQPAGPRTRRRRLDARPDDPEPRLDFAESCLRHGGGGAQHVRHQSAPGEADGRAALRGCTRGGPGGRGARRLGVARGLDPGPGGVLHG